MFKDRHACHIYCGMSFRLFADDLTEFQRLLKSAGLLKKKIDGVWGPDTDEAAVAFENLYEAIKASEGAFDARSEGCIVTLNPKAQTLARQCLRAIRAGGVDARIISGTRSYREQDKLFRQGRSGYPGPIVTNARGGQSNHNFGIAWDIGIFDAKGKYLGDSPLYKKAATIAMSAGLPHLEWGGDWKTFKDQPHYQFATGLPISEIRARFESGQPII
jgi:peptidoglycan L-alanyl-D-glutamate endopeptidase CwlK